MKDKLDIYEEFGCFQSEKHPTYNYIFNPSKTRQITLVGKIKAKGQADKQCLSLFILL